MGKMKLGVFACLCVCAHAGVLCAHVHTCACVLGDCAQHPRTDTGIEGLPRTTGWNSLLKPERAGGTVGRSPG